MDPSSTAGPIGVTCEANKECNCTAVGIDTVRAEGLGAGDIVRTCMPPRGEVRTLTGDVNDRKFEVLGGIHTFEIFAYDVDGGVNTCLDQVELYFSDGTFTRTSVVKSTSFFQFINSAPIDCLIEVRIT